MAKVIEYKTDGSVRESMEFYKEYFKSEDIAARSRKKLGALEKERQNKPLNEEQKKKQESLKLYFERFGEEIEAKKIEISPE